MCEYMYEPELSFSVLDTVFPLLMTWKQASEICRNASIENIASSVNRKKS